MAPSDWELKRLIAESNRLDTEQRIANDVSQRVLVGASYGYRCLGRAITRKQRAVLAGRMHSVCDESPPEVHIGFELISQGSPEYVVVPGYWFHGFEYDFAIFRGPKIICFIECDSTAYHSTEPQITRDRLKDDIAGRHGIRVIRRWANEISLNSEMVASDLWQEIGGAESG